MATKISSILLNSIIIIILCGPINKIWGQTDRVKLKDIQALTFFPDKYTETRRSEQVRQMSCVGTYCDWVHLQSIQCYNRGFDGRAVQWECKADMPNNYRFGQLTVSCEGYESPSDEYVLAGSCKLKYSIEKRSKSDPIPPKTTNFRPAPPPNQNNPGRYKPPLGSRPEQEASPFSWWPIILVGGFMFLTYFCCIKGKNKNAIQGQPGAQPGRMGGLFGMGNRPTAPPPPGFNFDPTSNQGPYEQPPPYNPNPLSAFGGMGMREPQRPRGGGGSGLPGILGGLAAGGLGGYLFGRSRDNPMSGMNSFMQQRPTHWDSMQASAGASDFDRDDNFGVSTGLDMGGGDDDIGEVSGFASTEVT